MSMTSKLAAVLASLCVLVPAQIQAAPPLADRNVIILRPEKNIPAGAGVLIAPRLVLTAEHVVHASIVQVVCKDQIIPGVVRGGHEGVDLALLELLSPCLGVQVSQLADADPQLAEDVYAIGCPEARCGRVSRGIVSSYEHNRLITDAKVWFGSSGGGLFTADGKLVGISSMIHIMSDAGTDRDGNKKNEPFSQVWGIYVPPLLIRSFLMVTFMQMEGKGDADQPTK